ncbi:MAG TPA: sulfite exporter TauE/SafE family protein [Candidatus Krumholzibacteria bacterium]|nr:sulfite exporter TauE/SafE family protein [Candidatus Krumholzibacteria bacterium]HPD73184.1 sulfite exporter TauE/SafE family protein [Candidatus Krumholzibacteria bacterium]HRY41938.1 sulfite exporter TauE/SafE family protein [Candidatus Krumholzibacteria bacterium]
MEFNLINALILLAAGGVAGVAAGFAGVGGGIVLVPVLLELLRAWGLPRESVVQAAMGTSLAVAFVTTVSAAWRHHRQRLVLWRLVVPIVPASMLGGWLGSELAARTDGRVLQALLAAALLYASVRLVRQREPGGDATGLPIRSVWIWAAIGLGVGVFSGMSGLAGGVVLIPALALVGKVPGRYLAATSAGVILFTALAAAVGYMRHGPAAGSLGDGFVGFTCLPASACLAVTSVPFAQVGARLNKRTSGVAFRRVFAAIMVVVVARLVATL